MSEPGIPEEDERRPGPTPRGALLLTLLAAGLQVLLVGLLAPVLGSTFALGLSAAVGLGVVGSLVARRVPEPTEVRLGLVGFRPIVLPMLLLVVPAVILSSEIDNVVAVWIDRPVPVTEAAASDSLDPEAALDPDSPMLDPEAGVLAFEAETLGDSDEPEIDPLAHLEWTLFAVLLRPLLEEFFFRGLVFQGVAHFQGVRAAVFASAALFALWRMGLGLLMGPFGAASLASQAMFEGSILGVLRAATGSIGPAILLHAAMQAAGVLAGVYEDSLPIPGFNAGGEHTPATWIFACTISVVLGLALVRRAGPAAPGEPDTES